MSEEIKECPSCGGTVISIGESTKCSVCGWPSLMNEPDMPHDEGSEIVASIDLQGVGMDNVIRPVMIGQDDGEIICLTLADAKRLQQFLNEAVPYLEQQTGLMQQ